MQAILCGVQQTARQTKLLLPKTDNLIMKPAEEEGYSYAVVQEQCTGTKAEAEVRHAGDNAGAVGNRRQVAWCCEEAIQAVQLLPAIIKTIQLLTKRGRRVVQKGTVRTAHLRIEQRISNIHCTS